MKTTTVTAKWIGPELEYEGTDSQGNRIKMGGEDGLSPAQMLLLGAAGCMGMDVVVVLKKKRINIEAIEVKVIGLQEDDYPKPYKVIDINFKIKGDKLTPKVVERAIALSRDKYCVVGQTLQQETEIQTSFEIDE